MLSLRRPSDEAILAFLDAQSKLGLTYSEVGATATTPPAGYTVDRTRFRLGRGDETFVAAGRALARWSQFDLGWIEIWPREAPLRAGEVIALVARRFGLWWLSACRIVYVIDEAEPPRRFGFAYGTLPDHAGTGEERFVIEQDPESGEVWYDVLAFSRPNWLATRLGYRAMRRLQRRFGRDSAAAMLKAISADEEAMPPDRPGGPD